MAKAPGKAIDFDGAGNVWFKVFEITANADPKGINNPIFPATSESAKAFLAAIIVFRSDKRRHLHNPTECPKRRVSIA